MCKLKRTTEYPQRKQKGDNKEKSEINEIGKKKDVTEQITQAKYWFFGKINKVDKLLVRLI